MELTHEIIDRIEGLDEARELLREAASIINGNDQENGHLKNELATEKGRREIAEKEREALHMELTKLKSADRRKRLPDTRNSITRTFRIPRPNSPDGEFQMYAIVGLYEDRSPGEIFLDTDKEGSFASAALDAAAMTMSMALQYGAPLRPLLEKWKGMRFPPDGITGDPKYQIVSSPLDYLARWMLDTFCQES